MSYKAEILLDSVSPAGVRITSILATYPLFIHAEMLTHRTFSRNACSNRALPVLRNIAAVEADPIIPERFPLDQPGMVADNYIEPGTPEYNACLEHWLEIDRAHLKNVEEFYRQWRVHKQLTNRKIAHMQWITAMFTATHSEPGPWTNLFALRRAADAQPETQTIANMMHEAIETSVPVERTWHTPFVKDEENIPVETALLVSAARCGRLSYLTHPDGDNVRQVPTIEREIEKARELAANRHMSPFEHQAFAAKNPAKQSGNFTGWIQNRKSYKGECR